MIRVRISDLNDALKAFLAPIVRGETIIVEDDNGALQFDITPCVQASAMKKFALAALGQLRRNTDKAVNILGISESAVDQELQG